MNPEAGDTIFFNNESIDVIEYAWDFGNGKDSETADTYTFYETRGSYNVTLKVSNKTGSDSLSQSIHINAPTIMAFYVFMPDSLTPLSSCNVFVYDNKEDWEIYDNPLFSALTDAEGLAAFPNLEDITYYILIYKRVADGIYITGGFVDGLELNVPNYFAVATEFLADKKSLDNFGDDNRLIRMNVKKFPSIGME
ncbi:MAG: PKD domain-containing protein [Bacteroidales bacterium]